jgi:hypothetical protein
MGKVEEYREKLRSIDCWDAFLKQESRLPGPRANLELACAVASEGTEGQLLRYAGLDCEAAPPNTPEEFLAVCGVIGLGYLTARGEGAYLPMLRACASDPRWRIREAVALGLQEYGRKAMGSLLEVMTRWSTGTLLEKRAVVAALCEPCLLVDQDHAARVLELLEEITVSVLCERDRKSEGFRVLRKGLAYGWSVAVVAQPAIGKPSMERWIHSQDADIRWIMKQNLGKNRLLRMDPAWVRSQLEALGS